MQGDRESAQIGHGCRPVRLHSIKEDTARLCNDLAEPGEFRVPGRCLSWVSLESSVALAERSLVPHPGVHELRFHVEHRPIHPAAPAITAFLHQPMHAGLDGLDGKGLGQLGK